MPTELLAKGRTQGFHLRRPTRVSYPSRISVIAFDSVLSLSREHGWQGMVGESRYDSLCEWYTCNWRVTDGRKTRQSRMRGVTQAGYWRYLMSKVSEGGTHWVFGWDMYPFLCLVDVFNEITEGRLSITTTREDAVNLGTKEGKMRLHGTLIAENPPTIIVVNRPGGGVIKFIDLANFGIPNELSLCSNIEARLRDAESTIDHYIDMLKEFDLGSFSLTAASQGYYAFRRSHMIHDVKVHPFAEPLKLERQAYIGGRCECRRIGKLPGKIYHLDINSQYTAIGRYEMFPSEFVAFNADCDYGSLSILAKGACVIADVTIKTEYPDIPFRDENKIIFPVGEFRTQLCWPELELASRIGEIVSVHQASLYVRCELFASWSRHVESCIRTLKESGRFRNLAALKRITNSLYGKFGQLDRRWDTVPGRKHPDPWAIWWEMHPDTGLPRSVRCLNGLVQEQSADTEGKLACPAISAYMCSYARRQLADLIRIAGRDNVYYYDTDSVMVNHEGYQALLRLGMLNDTELGKLKTKEVSEDVELLGVKHYRFGDRFVLAGARGSGDRGSKPSDTNVEHVGFNSGLWHKRAGEAKQIVRKFLRTRKYQHGIVNDDGSVSPFRIVPAKPLEVSNSERV